MRNTVLFFMLLTAYSINTHAQKGSKQIWIGTEFGKPLQNDLHAGYGINAEALFGLSKTGQFTISAGYARFVENNALAADKSLHTRLLSVLAGYRYHIGNFFIEPQLGIGEMGGKTNVVKESPGSDPSRPSVVAAFAALNTGYTYSRFSVGTRIQAARGIDNAKAGFWRNRSVSYASLFIAYRLFAGK